MAVLTEPGEAGAQAGKRADRSRSPKRLKVETAQTAVEASKEEEEDLVDGFTAAEILENKDSRIGHTFDDLICLPGHIDFGVFDVSISSRFTKKISLKVPLVSSPMDTVTEYKMAVGMALQGGIGVIHRSMSIAEQCSEVRKVKRYKAGMITDPVCVPATATLAELTALAGRCKFSGFPVTENGCVGSKLLGLVTNRDTEFAGDQATTVDKLMTEASALTTAEEGVDLATANDLLRQSKKGKLPIVTKAGELVGLIARADLKKSAEFPKATKDAQGRLQVAAAVGLQLEDRDRVRALVKVGVDAIVMPHKVGASVSHLEMIRWVKQEFPQVEVVGGNVANASQARKLIECGADAIRVGMGTGSMSTAQDVCACGRAQASAVYHVAAVASRAGIPVIADGGLGSPGQILKALMLGADTAMCGSLLAGAEESAGEYIMCDGKRLKSYRGSYSLDAMAKGDGSSSSRQVIKVAQGVSGAVVDRGTLRTFIPYVAQGLMHGMQDIGTRSIETMHKQLRSGELRFEVRSAAAQREGSVHGLHSYENKLYA